MNYRKFGKTGIEVSEISHSRRLRAARLIC